MLHLCESPNALSYKLVLSFSYRLYIDKLVKYPPALILDSPLLSEPARPRDELTACSFGVGADIQPSPHWGLCADQANDVALEKGASAAQDALRAVSQLEAYLSITAPFDGQVTTRFVHPGALVGPGGGPGTSTPIVQIQTLTRHRLVVPVPENDAAGIPEGTEVSFTVPSYPGRIFKAPISRISRSVDVKTRTMPVELDIRDPRGELTPGIFCEVSWPLRRSYATLFVPATAVGSDLERTFVIRVRDNRAEWVDVKTGASSGNSIEVFGDLREGDEVALRGTDELSPGTQVSPHLITSK